LENPRRDWRLWLALGILALIAFVLRSTDLESRPMHTDEAVNAVILGNVLEGQVYRYDPEDRHGPTLYFFAQPWLRLIGVDSLAQMEAWQLRLVPAFFGAASILLLGLLVDGLGRAAVIGAGLIWAVYAPVVYFSRVFIHEPLFHFLLLLALAAAWRWDRDRKWGWMVLAGVGVGLAQATKETAVLVWGAGLIAVIITASTRERAASWLPAIFIGIAVALSAAVVAFSSFGQNWAGVLDAVTGYVGYARRAGGQGHEKPWFTYFIWLWKAGPVALCLLSVLLVVGCLRAWVERHRDGLPAFLALSGFALLMFYSAIPYKTPWLMLAPVMVLTMVSAFGADWLIGFAPKVVRPWFAVVLAVAWVLPAAASTKRWCFERPIDERNPFAYSPTVTDVRRLPEWIRTRAGDDPLIQVIGDDYWPLPWELRRFPRVGYWAQPPEKLDGDIVLASADVVDEVSKRLGEGWRPGFFGLRPGVLILSFSREAL